MIRSVIYTARATTTGGRTGASRTDDDRLSVTLDTPGEMGGNDGPGTNPEQLFAAGYSACFLSAVKSVGRAEKLSIPEESTVTATVAIGASATGPGYGLAVGLEVHIPGLPFETVTAIVEKAHAICPYSNATRGNVEVRLSVV